MNEMPVAPVPDVPEPRPESPIQIWQKALTRPNEQTYAEIASSPHAKASTAYLWMFVAYLIQLFLSALVSNRAMQALATQYGYGQYLQNRGFGSTLVGAICGAPIGAIIGTLFFALGIVIIQWLARTFGGRGTTDQLAYAVAAILAPYLILSGIVGLFSAIPYVGYCISAILALVGLYILFLEITAVKGVNGISWGAAIGAVLIPIAVVAFLCACLIGGSLAALVPVIRNAVPTP